MKLKIYTKKKYEIPEANHITVQRNHKIEISSIEMNEEFARSEFDWPCSFLILLVMVVVGLWRVLAMQLRAPTLVFLIGRV